MCTAIARLRMSSPGSPSTTSPRRTGGFMISSSGGRLFSPGCSSPCQSIDAWMSKSSMKGKRRVCLSDMYKYTFLGNSHSMCSKSCRWTSGESGKCHFPVVVNTSLAPIRLQCVMLEPVVSYKKKNWRASSNRAMSQSLMCFLMKKSWPLFRCGNKCSMVAGGRKSFWSAPCSCALKSQCSNIWSAISDARLSKYLKVKPGCLLALQFCRSRCRYSIM
mmetsp:Transcript_75159/g.229961  ORF Transcript_75159/g.229961 Transcript_75159/m.229961 type:complete len:218 (-) Transcript_75159:1214-1867(-)